MTSENFQTFLQFTVLSLLVMVSHSVASTLHQVTFSEEIFKSVLDFSVWETWAIPGVVVVLHMGSKDVVIGTKPTTQGR